MAKREDNKAAKQRRQERERQRRKASANREPGPEEFSIKMPQPTIPGGPLDGRTSPRSIGTDSRPSIQTGRTV
jgi:hypothetical protein